MTTSNIPPFGARGLNIAIVGLGFGAEFIPIYQLHPNANMYAICQRNVELFLKF
jgi:predicted dehydrogenase